MSKGEARVLRNNSCEPLIDYAGIYRVRDRSGIVPCRVQNKDPSLENQTMKYHILFAVALIVGLGTLQTSGREWTDATGRFKVQAELVKVKDGVAHLKKTDGKLIKVALEKLSQADRRYLGNRGKKSATKPTWRKNVTRVSIPSAPAEGMAHGARFKVNAATFENGVLMLQQRKDSSLGPAFMVFVFLKEGETIDGKKFKVKANDDTFGIPHIHFMYQVEGEDVPETDMFMQDYAMKLEFGKVSGGKLPGRIYLCLPDDKKSFVAGTFEAEMKPSED